GDDHHARRRHRAVGPHGQGGGRRPPLGPDRGVGGAPVGRGSDALTHLAQVVPNLATFAVDDGFAYRVPDTLSGVETGSLVRVPLGGRRVRGFVTHLRTGPGDTSRLRDVIAVV